MGGRDKGLVLKTQKKRLAGAGRSRTQWIIANTA
jgi:hypothetical protein